MVILCSCGWLVRPLQDTVAARFVPKVSVGFNVLIWSFPGVFLTVFLADAIILAGFSSSNPPGGVVVVFPKWPTATVGYRAFDVLLLSSDPCLPDPSFAIPIQDLDPLDGKSCESWFCGSRCSRDGRHVVRSITRGRSPEVPVRTLKIRRSRANSGAW